MMKIAVVDDEKIWLYRVLKFLELYYKEKEVEIKTFLSGTAFLEACTEYDIVIMDLEMPELDGFQAIVQYKQLYNNCKIIILTTHMELSRKGYMVEAFRYLDKKNLKEELMEALSAIERLDALKETVSLNIVNMGKRNFVISDIIFIETEKRNIRVHVKDNSFICTETLEYLEAILTSKGFFRSHKSFLVNLNAIRSFDRKDIYMINGEKAMVSMRKYSELKKHYLEYRYEYANF